MFLIQNESLIKSEEEIHIEFQKIFSFYLSEFQNHGPYFYEKIQGMILGISSVFKNKETRDLYENGCLMLARCRAHFECDPLTKNQNFLENLFLEFGMRWEK